METILKILTLGLYGLFSKSKRLEQKTSKVKYRIDGTVKKKIDRETNYGEEDSPDLSNEL